MEHGYIFGATLSIENFKWICVHQSKTMLTWEGYLNPTPICERGHTRIALQSDTVLILSSDTGNRNEPKLHTSYYDIINAGVFDFIARGN